MVGAVRSRAQRFERREPDVDVRVLQQAREERELMLKDARDIRDKEIAGAKAKAKSDAGDPLTCPPRSRQYMLLPPGNADPWFYLVAKTGV